MRLKFGKTERLKSKKLIDEVFSNGKSIKNFPFVLKYLRTNIDANSNVQIVVSVPKRKVKNASDRNRLKRQIKEAYRLNKNELTCLVEQQEKGLALFLIYTGKVKEDYHFIESKLKLILQELIKSQK